MHLVRAGFRSPVDRAALEVIEASDAVGSGRFSSQRLAKETADAAEALPLLRDGAVDLEAEDDRSNGAADADDKGKNGGAGSGTSCEPPS